MRSARRLISRPAAGWLILILVIALPVAVGSINPEVMKAVAAVIGAVAWPAAFLIALWWLKPEASRVVDRLTEFNAFGVNAKLNTLEAAFNKATKEVEEAGVLSKTPTTQQIGQASKLKDALGENSELVRSQVAELADEYLSIRASLPSGPERTRRMEVVVAKMRTIGLAAYPLRYDLAASPSPGIRLQAIASLQVMVDYDMLDWLADRVGSEKPFVAYHALVALNISASSPMSNLHRNSLRLSLSRAENFRNQFGADTDRKMMLDDFKRRVESI